MEEMQDYYALLGVPHNASAEDITRAWHRKQREYQNDEEKKIQLNQASEILRDPAERKKYDIQMQFGNQIGDIKEKIRSSKTVEQKNEYLLDAQRIYLDILKVDNENIDALWNLVEIEKSLENEEQAISYLKELEKYTDGDDKLYVYHRLGELYRGLKRTDEAIKCFYAIYMADVAYADDIKELVRLLYEEKMNIKAAVQILNDCINRSSDSKLKIIYLCEVLRAIQITKNPSYQKIEEAIYAKLEKFHTDDEESNLVNAAAILVCMEDVTDGDNFECFHRLEKIYKGYDIDNAEVNRAFENICQLVALAEKGMIHEAINLYLGEQWTKEIKEQLSELIIKEAEKIKESLECIKKEAPAYWNQQKEFLDLEEIVNDKLNISKEFNILSTDKTISSYMKKMMECILLTGVFVTFDDVKDEFADARDSFFDKEDKGKLQHTLRKMEEYYPLCYKIFSDIFFEGKSTQELSKPTSVNSDSNAGGLWYLWGYVIGGLLLFEVPPLGAVILFLTYSYAKSKSENPLARQKEDELAQKRAREEEIRREKKVRRKEKVRKCLKTVFALTAAVLIGAVIVTAGGSIKEWVQRKQEEEYAENHNFLLTDGELKERDKLDKEYREKTNVDIHILQTDINSVGDYPDGEYVWLVIQDGGWYANSYALENNFLFYDEYGALLQEINDLYSSDDSDFEKCEKFYALAYDYVQAHQARVVTVPNIMGMTMEEAETELAKYGLYLEQGHEEYSSDYKEGTILYQSTESGTFVEKGTVIYVNVSLGDKETIVPDIIGMTVEEAQTELAKYRLYLKKENEKYSPDYKEGTIMYQYAGNGEVAEKGTAIGVDVSLGELELYDNLSSQCFYLQKSSVLRNLTIDDILRCWNISENDYIIMKDYDTEGYIKNTLIFDALFYGLEGYLVCELRVSENTEQPQSINFYWYPYTKIQPGVIEELLVSDGYTVDSRDSGGYSEWWRELETDMGKVRLKYYNDLQRIIFFTYN